MHTLANFKGRAKKNVSDAQIERLNFVISISFWQFRLYFPVRVMLFVEMWAPDWLSSKNLGFKPSQILTRVSWWGPKMVDTGVQMWLDTYSYATSCQAGKWPFDSWDNAAEITQCIYYPISDQSWWLVERAIRKSMIPIQRSCATSLLRRRG